MENIKEKIVRIYQEEVNNYITNGIGDRVKMVAAYVYYHYFNADETSIDEMNSTFYFKTQGFPKELIAVEDDTINYGQKDFIFCILKDEIKGEFMEYLRDYIDSVTLDVGRIVYNDKDEENSETISKYISNTTDYVDSYKIIILCDFNLSEYKEKELVNDVVSKMGTKENQVEYDILFLEDIEDEIRDVETPHNFVEKETINLFFDDSICYFGEEKSFISFVSAKSIKYLYENYYTKGLLANNLRYYVKNKKIDSKIIDSINSDYENFCYYNNGLIITCSDYTLLDKQLTLKDFSIVNGGQTTNIIGRTIFEHDFPILIKVIKQKYKKVEDQVNFLSKVAEASNTQKPINQKDLIANRIEQRLLKKQCEENCGIFLQIKRGEKIDKSTYPEKWQNTTNDSFAQHINSFVFQSPGSSKNSKSKMLENDAIYDKIFKNSYSDNFIISIQRLRASFDSYSKKYKKIKDTSKLTETKKGLVSHCNLIVIAIIGLLYKLYLNKTLIPAYNTVSKKTEYEEVKVLLGQNDISKTDILRKNFLLHYDELKIFKLFDYIVDNILVSAYTSFRNKYYNFSFGHLSKSDMHYFNFIVPKTIGAIVNNSFAQDVDFENIFDSGKKPEIITDIIKIKVNDRPGLKIELQNLNKEIDVKYPNTNIQKLSYLDISKIMTCKYKTISELRNAYLSINDESIKTYGNDIIKLVKKYTDIDDFKISDNNSDENIKKAEQIKIPETVDDDVLGQAESNEIAEENYDFVESKNDYIQEEVQDPTYYEDIIPFAKRDQFRELQSELKNYRKRNAELRSIKENEILTDEQINKIAFRKYTTLDNLRNISDLKSEIIDVYGHEIIEVVSDYLNKYNEEAKRYKSYLLKTTKALLNTSNRLFVEGGDTELSEEKILLIIKNKPLNKGDLVRKCGFTYSEANILGEEIIKILEKNGHN